MTFTVKQWQNQPSTLTPLSAAAMIDLEARLSNYTDQSLASLNNSALQALPIAAVLSANSIAVLGSHNPFNATTGPIVVTLPSPLTAGSLISIEKTDGSLNPVTVSGDIEEISNASHVLYLAHETILLESDSLGSWWPIGGFTPYTSLRISSARTRTVTAATTITLADRVVEMDADSAAFSQALPAVASFSGKLTLICSSTGANEVTLTTNGTDTITVAGQSGVTSLALGGPSSAATYQAVDLVPDTSVSPNTWRVV